MTPMEWFYEEAGQQQGPVDEATLQNLVGKGTVTPETLVWRSGMAGWQSYRDAVPTSKTSAELNLTGVVCADCGRRFERDQVVEIAGALVCADCKPLRVQKLTEGASLDKNAAEIRRSHLNHEASVKSVGFLYCLGGLAIFAGGVFSLIGGAGSQETEAIATGAVLVLLGALQFYCGLGIRRLKRWTRIPVGILSGLGLLAFPLGTLINAYILYLVFSAKGRMVLSDEYKQVIADTPEIKYKTSILVWVLLVIVLVFIAAGIGAALFKR